MKTLDTFETKKENFLTLIPKGKLHKVQGGTDKKKRSPEEKQAAMMQ